MKDISVQRPTLGPFMSVICFRYLHDDAMDLAGRALIVDAGRQRGQDLIEELGLVGSYHGADALQQDLYKALGPDGTRLCLIQRVEERDNGGFEVKSIECASPIYTLGVLIGAISSMNGKTMMGKDATEENPQSDGAHIYLIDPL